MSRWTCSLALVLVLGCSEEAPPSTDGVGAPVQTPRARERSGPDPLYDAHGVPLESEERVAGLVLPRGLTENEAVSEERRHVYVSRVPPDRLLRYFGPRLTTVQIDQHGENVTYRDAIPRGVRGGVVHLDVTVRPSSANAAVVEILELSPPPPDGVTVPEEEIPAAARGADQEPGVSGPAAGRGRRDRLASRQTDETDEDRPSVGATLVQTDETDEDCPWLPPPAARAARNDENDEDPPRLPPVASLPRPLEMTKATKIVPGCLPSPRASPGLPRPLPGRSK